MKMKTARHVFMFPSSILLVLPRGLILPFQAGTLLGSAQIILWLFNCLTKWHGSRNILKHNAQRFYSCCIIAVSLSEAPDSVPTWLQLWLQGWSWISSKTVRQIGFSQRSTWKHSEWRCLRWDIGYRPQSLYFDIFNGSGLLWADPTGEGAWGKNHTESWQRYLTLGASVSWWLGFRSREPDSGGKDRTKNATFQHFVRQIKLPMQRGYSNQRSCWVAEPFGGCYTKFPSISTAFFPQTSTCTTFGTAQWSIQQQHFCTWP